MGKGEATKASMGHALYKKNKQKKMQKIMWLQL